MNELLTFFSTYNIDWTQTSLLSFSILAGIGIIYKITFGKKKRHWTESKHQSEVVKPALFHKSLNFDSVMTSEVDRLINPRYSIDEGESEFILEKPSKDSSVEVSSMIKTEPSFFPLKSEDNGVKPMQEPSVDYDFLNEITSESNNSEILMNVTSPYQESKVEIIVPELTEIVETNLISSELYSKIPTLTEVYEPATNSQFINFVNPKISEEQLSVTQKYHFYIEEALVYDQQNNKEQAVSSLKHSVSLIENVRINFYLKIAIQSYISSVIQNSLPSIINQFYIIEKENLIKENQKEQDLLNPISVAPFTEKESVLWKSPTIKDFSPENLLNNETIYSSNYLQEVLPPTNDILSPMGTEFNAQKTEEDIYSQIDSSNLNNDLINSSIPEQNQTCSEPSAPEYTPLEKSENPATVKSSIDNEFKDEENKNKFLNAFGNMFTPDTSEKDNEMSLEISLPAKQNSTVWVNWILSKNGKMNFKNNIVELNSMWCTKASVEELNSYLEGLAGEGNQFIVISVQNVKS